MNWVGGADYQDEQGNTFKVRIVAALSGSILQGSVFIPEDEFVRRFPADGSGGALTVGWRFKAIMRPGEPEDPDPGSACGGAATWGAPRDGAPPPDAVR